ncbi:MAG: 3D domain-containing protein [Lachnospiraceae bacterium]|nr:3D domain-containing protein [Lachnospiraceae bacterium]
MRKSIYKGAVFTGILFFLLFLGVFADIPASAKSASKNKITITCKYKWKTTKVKVKKKKYLGKFYITHYCPCSRCCGTGGGRVTASGTTPTAGRTVGVNPRLIPYGTKLRVGKRSGYVAEDTGGGIGWKHLDIFCSSHQEALNAGVGYKKVWAEYYTYKKVRYRELIMYEEELNNEGFDKFLKALKISL